MAKKRAKRVLWFGDVHWSDRNEAAVEIVEKAAERFRPDVIVDIGDLLNCDAFSRHPKQALDETAEYDYVAGELDPAWKWSRRMEKHAREQYIQMGGNHDDWMSRYLASMDDGRRAFKSLLPERYMTRDRSRGYRYIPFYKQHGDRRGAFHLPCGVLFVHGWAAPKYAAERHLQLAKPFSVIFGHTHRAETRTAPMYDGRVTTAINAGCLCKLQPKYAHGGSPTEWTTGFGVLYAGARSFTAYPIAIRDNSCVLPNGTEVRA